MNTAFRLYKLFRTEIRVIFVTLSVLILLPIISVVVVANTGLKAVSGALAAVNPVSHLVEVFDANHQKVAELQLSTVWPVRGYVSLEFGVPHWPYQETHTGIDIANEWGRIGDPVTTFSQGRVINTADNGTKLLGKQVVVDHGNNITSVYGHLSEIDTSVGDEVMPGDVIGREGSTGVSEGPHVHFEIRVYGIPVNPRLFMVGDPLRNVWHYGNY